MRFLFEAKLNFGLNDKQFELDSDLQVIYISAFAKTKREENFILGDLGEFPLKYKLFLKTYRWRRIDPVPWAPVKKPLNECRLALASSAGLVVAGQTPFDGSIRGGDYSFREIPSDTDMSALIDTHRSDLYDHSGIRRDANLAFPLDRVRELAETGRIGSLNHRHLSFMGSITAPNRLAKKTAPAAADKLVEDKVDIALLIPV